MAIEQSDLEKETKALLIIHFSMVMGILIFVALPLILGGEANRGDDFIPKFAICTAVFVGTSVASALFPGIFIRQRVQKYSTGVAYTTLNLFELLQASHILRMAFLEGSAMLSCMMFFVSRDPVFLVFPGVFLVLGVILIPTQAKILAQIQDMEEKIRQGV